MKAGITSPSLFNLLSEATVLAEYPRWRREGAARANNTIPNGCQILLETQRRGA